MRGNKWSQKPSAKIVKIVNSRNKSAAIAGYMKVQKTIVIVNDRQNVVVKSIYDNFQI